jgi:UDP-2,3-diacylglucosamine pyrophosphatase LpxH
MPQPIAFVSDLHLFTRRSEASQYHDSLCAAAGRSHVCVLGGDIFDFRWSTLGTTRATIEAAIGWLEELARDCPDCQFHYLLGNHDYNRRFIERLGQWQGTVANLCWHRYYLRLGDSVFLHGDVKRRTTPERLARARTQWLHAKPPGKLQSEAYHLFFRAGLHKPLPYLVHPKRRVARRIMRYLGYLGEGPQTGVRHVYFGHIHRRMSNYRYRGMMFHNAGASIKGQRLRILEAVIS